MHNTYFGVEIEQKEIRTLYKARIHINGNYLIGRFSDLHKAAIAYKTLYDQVQLSLNLIRLATPDKLL